MTQTIIASYFFLAINSLIIVSNFVTSYKCTKILLESKKACEELIKQEVATMLAKIGAHRAEMELCAQIDTPHSSAYEGELK